MLDYDVHALMVSSIYVLRYPAMHRYTRHSKAQTDIRTLGETVKLHRRHKIDEERSNMPVTPMSTTAVRHGYLEFIRLCLQGATFR